MPRIHPTATLTGGVELADDVEIGPHCSLDASRGPIRLARGVRLYGHNYLQGPLSIAELTVVYPFACLGFEPQDYKFTPGMPTAGVTIGARCLIREHATVHAASNNLKPTRVGDRCFLMVNAHVAHDCTIGNNVVMVNGAGVAGHSEVGDNVTLGGNALIHQHCRVGRLVMMSGDCGVSLDVPPFCTVSERNRIGGINLVGLRRSGMPREHITQLQRVFREAFRKPVPRDEALRILREHAADCPPIAEMADFVAATKRGIVPGMGKPPRDRGDRGRDPEEAARPDQNGAAVNADDGVGV